MSKLTSDISMSLDGFITDPDASVGTALEGNDPGRLHDWRFDAKTSTDMEIVAELYASTGAFLIGRRMFDAGFDPWGDPPPFGRPVFVLTHQTRDPLPMQGGTTYLFVTNVQSGLEQAFAAAGEKDVAILGGGTIIREYLRAGLLDEVQIHIVPLLLGRGIRLFPDTDPHHLELSTTRCLETPGATHLRFEVVTRNAGGPRATLPPAQ
jgi:dihydrofolate reductase